MKERVVAANDMFVFRFFGISRCYLRGRRYLLLGRLKGLLSEGSAGKSSLLIYNKGFSIIFRDFLTLFLRIMPVSVKISLFLSSITLVSLNLG